MFKSYKPKQYGGSEGLEIKNINGFEQTCTFLYQNNLLANPKKATVHEFYTAVLIAKKQHKKSK